MSGSILVTPRSPSKGRHPALADRGCDLVLPSPLLAHACVAPKSRVGGVTDASVDRSTLRAIGTLVRALDGHAA